MPNVHNVLVRSHTIGVRIPRNKKEAQMLDRENGNAHWQDAVKTELDQLHKCKVFKSSGQNAAVPEGCQLTKPHFVFDVKQSLKRKACMVAHGDMADPP